MDETREGMWIEQLKSTFIQGCPQRLLSSYTTMFYNMQHFIIITQHMQRMYIQYLMRIFFQFHTFLNASDLLMPGMSTSPISV